MKIGINTLPLHNAHKDRGIGYYTRGLLVALKKLSAVEIQEFTQSSQLRDVDVIHYPWFDFFFHTLPNKINIPTVVTIHDVIPLKFTDHYPVGLRGKINFYLQKRALKKCNAVITDADISKRDITQFLGIKPEEITTIPLAVDKDFRKIRQSQLIDTQKKFKLTDKFLLYVGDVNWVKNLPFLIEGFNNVIKYPNLQDLKLVLIGGAFLENSANNTHPELQSLNLVNSLIKKFDLDKKILRLGNIDKKELIDIYNLATIYVQPSFYEGFGLPILEAMSCGLPVISSNKGSLPEVGGEAATFFDPNNMRQFESKVVELLNSYSLRLEKSKLGITHAEKFSWQKVAERTYEVYANITNL